MQYELETARQVDWQRQAAERRVVMEAEILVSGANQSVGFLRSAICGVGGRVLHLASVRGGAA
jgi:hypothetical protein